MTIPRHHYGDQRQKYSNISNPHQPGTRGDRVFHHPEWSAEQCIRGRARRFVKFYQNVSIRGAVTNLYNVSSAPPQNTNWNDHKNTKYPIQQHTSAASIQSQTARHVIFYPIFPVSDSKHRHTMRLVILDATRLSSTMKASWLYPSL